MTRFVPAEELFRGRHFDQEIMVLCVRWYTTILRWVRHYTPEFEQRWKPVARSVGDSWRMDET